MLKVNFIILLHILSSFQDDSFSRPLSLQQTYYISNGCVKFESAGEMMLPMGREVKNGNPLECKNKCLDFNSQFKYFITSSFPNSHYCDCFLDDNLNKETVKAEYCNVNCNQTCFGIGCEKCGSVVGSFGSKYEIKTGKKLVASVLSLVFKTHPTKMAAIINSNTNLEKNSAVFFKMNCFAILSIQVLINWIYLLS